jgi:hypothetical protein
MIRFLAMLCVLLAGSFVSAAGLNAGWNKGELPNGTWGWGGIVLDDQTTSGFYFADFRGDHVMIQGDDGRFSKRIEASRVGYWNNSIKLPMKP